MSDQQTRYVAQGSEVYDGGEVFAVAHGDTPTWCHTHACRIAAALSACEEAFRPQPGELARLRANYYTACQYASLDPDMPVPGGLTRDECGMWIASRDKTIAAQAAEIKALREERDAAIGMLAEWCVAVDRNGSSWDDWDHHYKDAMYRETSPPALRALLDAQMTEIRKNDESEATCSYCGGDGVVDSGGVTPWGAGIDIPCPACTLTESEAE